MNEEKRFIVLPLADGQGDELISRCKSYFVSPQGKYYVSDIIRNEDRSIVGQIAYENEWLRLTQRDEKMRYLRSKNVCLDVFQRQLWVDGKHRQLCRSEFSILELLMKNSRKIVARSTIMAELERVQNRSLLDNTLSAHISRLSKVVGRENIETRYGIGYLWVYDVEKSADFNE